MGGSPAHCAHTGTRDCGGCFRPRRGRHACRDLPVRDGRPIVRGCTTVTASTCVTPGKLTAACGRVWRWVTAAQQSGPDCRSFAAAGAPGLLAGLAHGAWRTRGVTGMGSDPPSRSPARPAQIPARTPEGHVRRPGNRYEIAVPVDRWPSAATLELIITVNYEATSSGSSARCPAACSREIQVRVKVLDDVGPACAGAAGYACRRGLMDHRPVGPAESRTTSATRVRAPPVPGRRAVGDPPDPRDLGPGVRQSWSSGR
jgi:hypothetical protein